MAITAYSVRDTKVGIAQQTTWGTAIADNANFNELDVESFVIERDLKWIDGVGAHGTRVADTADVAINQYESSPKCTIKGLANYLHLPYFFYGFFQSVTEAGSTPFGKTFTLHASQPDFTSNAGMFMTVINRSPSASTSEKIKDAVIQSLELSCEPGGQLMYSATFVGRGAVTTSSNPSGTWTRAAKTTSGTANYYPFATQVRHTCNFGSGATSLVTTGGWTLSLTQDVIPVGQDGTGNVQTFALSNKRGKFTGKILWDANSASAITNLLAGTVSTFNIGWGNATPGSVVRDLDLTFQGIFSKVDRDNAEVFGVDFEFDIRGTIATPTTAITAIIADAVDRSW